MREPNKDPWNVQSIYDLQFFNCPSCEFKDFSKQDFINHAHLSHFGSIKHLMNIKDGSLDDIFCPWNHQSNENNLEEKDNNTDIINEFKVDIDENNIHFDENDIEENNDNLFQIHKVGEEEEDNTNVDSSFYFEDETNEIDIKPSIIIPQIDKTKCKLTVQLEQIQLGYFECAHCEKIFEYEVLLNIHCREYHGIKNKEYHLKKTEIKYEPNIEDSFSLSRKNYVQKNNNFGGISYGCNKCSNSFNSAHVLKLHECSVNNVTKENKDRNTKKTEYVKKKYENLVHEVSYQCDKCERKYSKKRDLEYHISSIHEGKAGINSYKCNQCPGDLEFRLKEDFRRHNLKIHNIKDHSCKICTKRFGRRSELNLHIRSVHEGINIMCDYCSKTFSKKGDLNRHIQKIHTGIHECKKCGKTFSQSRYLNQHINFLHTKGRVKTFKCEKCDYTSHNNSNLNKHIIAIHEKPKELCCETCGKQCGSMSDLRRHTKAVHTKIKDFLCDKCDKAFSDKISLMKHINRVHERIKNFHCTHCSKSFFDKPELRLHVIQHHEPDKKDQCEECGSKVANLKLHINEVHRKIKNHQCSQCEKKFFTKFKLKIHYDFVHEGIRHFKCTKCEEVGENKSFGTPGGLQDHIKIFHLGQKDYKCDACGKAFRCASHLKRHTMSVHRK